MKGRPWRDVVIDAIEAITSKSGPVFKRSTFFEEKLAWMERQTRHKGQTPCNTVDNVLQALRDEGLLVFIDNRGTYEWLLGARELHPREFGYDKDTPVPHVPARILRPVRDSKLVARVKRLEGYACQLCGCSIELPGQENEYVEAHHIQPLGRPHCGPDTLENLIVVCPNHHVQLDYGGIELRLEDLQNRGHSIAPEYVAYHNLEIYLGSGRESG